MMSGHRKLCSRRTRCRHPRPRQARLRRCDRDRADCHDRLIKDVSYEAWLAWLDREFQWSEPTARNYMQIHETFGPNPQRRCGLGYSNAIPLPPRYLLATPSTPDEA